LREGRTGNLTIGTISSAGQWWIPSVAAALSENFPEVLLSVDLNEVPMAAAANYDIDIRTEDPTEPPIPVPGYRRCELAVEPYMLLVPADHPLATRHSVAAAELAGERWVDDQSGHSSCSIIRDNAWRAAGITPRYIARAADSHAAVTFVGAGVGITVLPRLAIGTPPSTVAVLEIDDPTPRRRIVMHIREGAEANPAIACAVRTLRQVAAAH
jgi:DNA-binding transcriptional LysR family regulator